MIVHGSQPGAQSRASIVAFGGVLFTYALLVLALFIAPLTAAHASERSALVLTGPADGAELSQHFEYALDPDWKLRVTDFIGSSAIKMQPVLGSVPDFGYTNSKVWLRIHIVNKSTKIIDWRFLAHVVFTQQMAIYKISSDGAVKTLVDLKEDSPFAARAIPYPQIVAPFDLAFGDEATFVVSYYAMGASRHSMSIETPDSLMQEARVNSAKSFAFYGMMLVMIVLAAVAFVTLRQFVFVAYAGYFMSIFLFVAQADGMAFQYIWSAFPQFNSMAAVVIGSSAMVFGGLFSMSFLQTGRYHPVTHRLLQLVIFSVLALDVILWATDPKLLNRVLVYMVVVSALSFLIAGLVAARTRFREVGFYVLAWGASLIPACLYTVRFAFGIQLTSITPFDAIRLALVVDALMMGLAIFDRYNHLRQSAMKENLANAQRTLALTQRLSALEGSYEQVTTSARQREESMKDTVHDLRQPMHALRLSLRQLASAQVQKSTDVGQIESALAYMEKLVEGRLASHTEIDESTSASVNDQVSDSTVKPRSDEPGLHGVLSGIAEMFTSEASNKGLELKLVLAAPDAEVAAYPLMRVVANLVSNAIKYTREGRVLIAVRRQGSGHVVEIHDTGPGLSGAAFEQALKRNQRLDRDRLEADGSGLGLSVVKEIADANEWLVTSCAARRTGASIRIHLNAK